MSAAKTVPQRLAPTFVWTMWAGAATVAGTYVSRYARRLPYSDDWGLVPVITGRRGLTLGWLWTPYAEHRLFVPKLVLSLIGRSTDADVRVPVWLNLVLLAALAALAIVTMRRVRGASTIGDAFFPVVLLTPSLPGLHWGFHFHFVSTSCSAVAVLLVMTRYGLDVPLRWMWASVALMLVFLGEGAVGLALLPGLGVWLVLSGLRLRHTKRVQGTLIVAAVCALGVGMALYFVGFPGSRYATRSPWDAIVISLHAATAPGGDSMSNVWPLSGVAVALGLIATAALLGVRWRDRSATPGDHDRAIALVCFGVALATLVGAIGFGRGSLGWRKGLEHHYSELLVPLACWVYVVWDRFAGPRRARFGIALLSLALASYAVNSERVWHRARDQRQEEAAFRRDLCNDVAPRTLARRYRHLLTSEHGLHGKPIAAGIKALRSRGMGDLDCP